MAGERFYENSADGLRRSAPAALRNREPIAEVLRDWLPASGTVLEIASGTGEHVIHFAERFPALDWQPSDIHLDAMSSINAWLEDSRPRNVRPPLVIDAAWAKWPIERADAILCINMVHISPWASALGLLDGAARLLEPRAPLILYGPWLNDNGPTAVSNLDFDSDLKKRNPEWGLRSVEEFSAAADERGLGLVETRAMPANNMMLLFRRY